MHFLTSISPKHINMQQQIDAVNSWLVHGKVTSLNHPEEIAVLKDVFKEVKFIPVIRTAKPLFSKNYVYIDDLIDIALSTDDRCMIINSDCEITDDKSIIDIVKSYHDSAFLYLHRWDYDKTKDRSVIYKMGVDAVLINKEHARNIPSSLFFLGSTHWDIWYPYAFYEAGCPLVTITSKPVIYHKKHPFQYDAKQWETLGRHCAWLMKSPTLSASQVSDRCYRTLNAATNFL